MNDDSPAPDLDPADPQSRSHTIAQLERLIAALRADQPFEIEVDHRRVHVPASAQLLVEHEQEGPIHELELQLRWRDDE